MSLKVPGRAGADIDMAETQPNHFTAPQRAPHEEGNGSPGLPPTLHERAKPPPESHERQPLPSVWDILERKVRLHAPDAEDRLKGKKHDLQHHEVSRLINDLKTDKGTDRDKLIIGLLNSITIQPGEYGPSERDLSLKEFQELRSKVERLTDEQISEEIRQQEVEKDQKIEEARKNGKILTLDLLPPPTALTCGLPALPDDLIDELNKE